jgi:hypothetical protein
MAETVQINRATVLSLWAAVTAERQGWDRDAALTIGKALAGLNARGSVSRVGRPRHEGGGWIRRAGRHDATPAGTAKMPVPRRHSAFRTTLTTDNPPRPYRTVNSTGSATSRTSGS